MSNVVEQRTVVAELDVCDLSSQAASWSWTRFRPHSGFLAADINVQQITSFAFIGLAFGHEHDDVGVDLAVLDDMFG